MRHTREALHKFEKRTCDRILGKQEEKRPTFFTEMMMGLFKRHGIKIHYSTIDNDDTLATHAQIDGANVVSNDNDFFRYNCRFKLYTLNIKGDLLFEPRTKNVKRDVDREVETVKQTTKD